MDVDVKMRDGVIVITLSGRIIGTAGDALWQVVEARQVTAGDPPKFLFDFADVPRMDSTALGVLAGLHLSIAYKGGRIGVINVGDAVDNLFAMTRLAAVFERFDSEAEAITALQG